MEAFEWRVEKEPGVVDGRQLAIEQKLGDDR